MKKEILPVEPQKSVILDLLEELKENLRSVDILNCLDPSAETLMEFASSYGSEIGMINNYPNLSADDYGIYMTFSNTNGEKPEDFLTAFMMNAHLFFPYLTEYLSVIFMENTNNDACSFKYTIDTKHAAMITRDDMDKDWDDFYEITVCITDYLS